MKIIMTGGGTGGHFYPIIAIAEEINNLIKENRLIKPEIYYMSDGPYNEGLLFENNITFKQISAGKIRRNLSLYNMLLNFSDLFKTFFGSISALWTVFNIYPDVIFGKGGYASFPALLAGRILRIPIIIHESDNIPGRVNRWAGKFAVRIALSYPESAKFFSKNKTAYTGNPIRKEIAEALSVGAHEYLHLDMNIPTILILGGSQGSKSINEAIMDALPELVEKYQVIHQTGKKNIDVIKQTSSVILENNQYKDRYKPFDYLNILSMRMAAGACNIVISRAGSTIFEIASWGKPSIIIPIPEKTSHDQKSNAYAYARTGSAVVIEEKNLVTKVLLSEIGRILEKREEVDKMSKEASSFSRRDAARLIAQEILKIALEHEK